MPSDERIHGGQELPADGSRGGALYYRPLSEGHDICVYPMIGVWKLCLSVQGSQGIEQWYEYTSLARTIVAAGLWSGRGEPLSGWVRSSEHQSDERWYEAPDPAATPSDKLISSAAVARLGAHDRVRLWSRGGLAGELVMVAGDGERIAAALGLQERP